MTIGVWQWLASRGAVFKAIAATIATVGTAVGILGAFGFLGHHQDGSSVIESNALAAALSRVQDAGSSRIETYSRIDLHLDKSPPNGVTFPKPPDERGSGVFDYRRRIGRLTFRRDGGWSGDVIFDDDRTYARYRRVNRGRWRVLRGSNRELSGLLLAPDPSQQLGYLRQLVDLRKVGKEPVFGVQATHYVGRRILDEAVVVSDTWSSQIASFVVERILVDAWIDASGLVRRINVTKSSPEITVTYTVDLHDFGVPVRVQRPRDS